jgi:hypothetical protein
VVEQLDLAPFLAACRGDGHGHPAYDPKTLVGLLLVALDGTKVALAGRAGSRGPAFRYDRGAGLRVRQPL